MLFYIEPLKRVALGIASYLDSRSVVPAEHLRGVFNFYNKGPAVKSNVRLSISSQVSTAEFVQLSLASTSQYSDFEMCTSITTKKNEKLQTPPNIVARSDKSGNRIWRAKGLSETI